eukprot:151442-Chlamydomonas_euryale.AAC.1
MAESSRASITSTAEVAHFHCQRSVAPTARLPESRHVWVVFKLDKSVSFDMPTPIAARLFLHCIISTATSHPQPRGPPSSRPHGLHPRQGAWATGKPIHTEHGQRMSNSMSPDWVAGWRGQASCADGVEEDQHVARAAAAFPSPPPSTQKAGICAPEGIDEDEQAARAVSMQRRRCVDRGRPVARLRHVRSGVLVALWRLHRFPPFLRVQGLGLGLFKFWVVAMA